MAVPELSASAATPALSLDGVSKSFWRGTTPTEALRDVSFDIRPGEFVSILGASGCGKTTLLRIMDGLADADAGTVRLGEKVVKGPIEGLAVVFQQDSLLPWRTVLANTAIGPEMRREKKSVYLERAREYLNLVGLNGFENHYPHQLSGGMRQRVNLARALTSAPSVMLMDEPFAALDAQTREVMQAELMRIWRETGKTIVFVTHQIDEAVFLSDRVIVLTARPGQVRAEVEINLPRPRDLAVKRLPEFAEHNYEIWRMIEEEVMRAIRQDGVPRPR
jgi:NitT/TauT family transport system ATP-binding protein